MSKEDTAKLFDNFLIFNTDLYEQLEKFIIKDPADEWDAGQNVGIRLCINYMQQIQEAYKDAAEEHSRGITIKEDNK